MATQTIWFITGTSRGIGLELTRQLLASPSNTVVAACRNPAKASALQGLKAAADTKGTLHVVTLDVTDSQSVRKSADEASALVGSKGVDYLVNNAGVNLGPGDTAFVMDAKAMSDTYTANVVAPAVVSQAFLPLVEKSTKKTIVNITSTLGSIAADAGPWHASYSITKTALNMLTYKQAKEKPDLTIISMCPGWLKTDLGGDGALLDVSVGVSGVLKTVLAFKHEDSGSFFNHEGKRVPW